MTLQAVPCLVPFLTGMLWNRPLAVTELRQKVLVNCTIVSPEPLLLLSHRLVECRPLDESQEADSLVLYGDGTGIQQSLCSAFLIAASRQSPRQHECWALMLLTADVDKTVWPWAKVLASLALVLNTSVFLGDTDRGNELSSASLSSLLCRNNKHSSIHQGLIF